VTTSEIMLLPHGLHWVDGSPPAEDLCSHGCVEFAIGGESLLTPRSGEFTLSATAMRLLRTLETERLGDGSPDGHLFPCCGFTLLAGAGETDVVILGCSSGVDFGVSAQKFARSFAVRVEGGRTWIVEADAWRSAVHGFADRIAEFHAAAPPKRPLPDDVEGYERFREEWRRRRGVPFAP
jgi:hypothetical protein